MTIAQFANILSFYVSLYLRHDIRRREFEANINIMYLDSPGMYQIFTTVYRASRLTCILWSPILWKEYSVQLPASTYPTMIVVHVALSHYISFVINAASRLRWYQGWFSTFITPPPASQKHQTTSHCFVSQDQGSCSGFQWLTVHAVTTHVVVRMVIEVSKFHRRSHPVRIMYDSVRSLWRVTRLIASLQGIFSENTASMII